jgi:hypothetical protein
MIKLAFPETARRYGIYFIKKVKKATWEKPAIFSQSAGSRANKEKIISTIIIPLMKCSFIAFLYDMRLNEGRNNPIAQNRERFHNNYFYGNYFQYDTH